MNMPLFEAQAQLGSRVAFDAGLRRHMLGIYNNMALGLLVTGLVAFACAWAAASLAGDVVTGSYTISFLAPAKGAGLRAKGIVIKPGRRQVIVRADVWSEDDAGEPTLVAVAQATIVPTG
jgi:hypothetical protein